MTDRIVSHPSTQEYRDNYDRVFGAACRSIDAHLQYVIDGKGKAAVNVEDVVIRELASDVVRNSIAALAQ